MSTCTKYAVFGQITFLQYSALDIQNKSFYIHPINNIVLFFYYELLP